MYTVFSIVHHVLSVTWKKLLAAYFMSSLSMNDMKYAAKSMELMQQTSSHVHFLIHLMISQVFSDTLDCLLKAEPMF